MVPPPATLAALELDHVLIAVSDLAQAGRELEERHGLASVEGGRHPGWGTANRIVPLGETYLELVAVVDEDEAASSAFGRWVGGATAGPARPLGWAVRTVRLDDVAGGLGLSVDSRSRKARDGRVVRWRMAALAEAAAEPFLPFFIEWEPGTAFPGHIPADHRDGPVQITELRLDGDADRLSEWLGEHHLPIAVSPGAPALAGIVLTGAAGEVVVGARG